MGMDDKALIAHLLQTKSDRIQLVEFGGARAEIWQIFRLVYIDDSKMPFAVCIRCMKPVAYSKKTTGSLHKHPCAVAAAQFWTKTLKRKSEQQSSDDSLSDTLPKQPRLADIETHEELNGESLFNNTGSSLLLTQLAGLHDVITCKQNGYSNGNGSIESLSSALVPSSQPQLNGHSKSFLDSLAALASVMNTSANSNGKCSSNGSSFAEGGSSEQSFARSDLVLDLSYRCLLPIDSQYLGLLNRMIGNKSNNQQLCSMLTSAYEMAKLDVQQVLQEPITKMYFVLDFWSDLTADFITIWACYAFDSDSDMQHRQILRTERIDQIKSGKKLWALIDNWLIPYCVDSSLCSDMTRIFFIENYPPERLRFEFLNEIAGKQDTQDYMFLFCMTHLFQRLIDNVLTQNALTSLQSLLCRASANASLRSPAKSASSWLGQLQSVRWKDNAKQLLHLLKELTENWDSFQKLLREDDEPLDRAIVNCSIDEVIEFAKYLDKVLTLLEPDQNGLFGISNFRSSLNKLVQAQIANKEYESLREFSRKLEKLLQDDTLDHILYRSAQCLHPKQRDLAWLSDEQKRQVHDWLDRQIEHENLIAIEYTQDEMVNGSEPNGAGEFKSAKSENDVEMMDLSNGSNMRAYLESDLSSLLPLSDDAQLTIDKFWAKKVMRKHFPELHEIAKRLRLIQLTPACCSLQHQPMANIAEKRFAISRSEQRDKLLFMHTYYMYGQGQARLG